MKQTKLLDEAGLIITPEYIAGPSHRFTFRGIKTIRLAHVPNIFGFFKKHPYQFIVNNFKTDVVIFETFDKALVSRIQAALSAARDTHARDGGITRSR